jgi:hypothetical protein
MYEIMYDIIHDGKVSTHRPKRAWWSCVKVALCRFKCRMFKIGDCDLVLSSTKPCLSSVSNASRPAIVGPSQASLLVVGAPTRPSPSSLSSDTVGACWRAGTRGNLLAWFCMQSCPSWSGTCCLQKNESDGQSACRLINVSPFSRGPSA